MSNISTDKETILSQLEKEEREKTEYIKFAQNSVSVKLQSSSSSTSNIGKVSVNTIRTMLEEPVKNYETLQAVSQALERRQGIYSRLLQYFSNALTYDYMIIPLDDIEDNNIDKILKNYKKSAVQLNKLNPKFHLAYFQYKRMLNGEIFVYKLEDSKGIVYKEIPNSYCRVIQNENNVFRYEVDFSKFKDDTILDFPQEFQTLYNQYKDESASKSKGKTNKSKQNVTTEPKWKLIGENGIAFPTRYDSLHSYPTLCYLFPELMEIEGVKELQLNIDKVDNVKLIHCEVPINKETGKPIMDKPLVDAYNGALKQNLPEGFASIVNPFKMESINVSNGASAERRNLVSEAIDKIYTQSGVSDLIFANKKASSEALKKSIEVDMQMLYNTSLPLFNTYLNYEIVKNKFQVLLLEVSYFNRDDKMKLARENMAYGGSRMHFMALNGFDPLQALNVLNFEQKVLGVNSLFIPAVSSHTISGTDNTGGRPSASETGTQSDITEQVNQNK